MSDVGGVQEWAEIARSQEPSAQAGNDGCVARFHMQAVQNKRQSKIEGRAVFEEHPFVQIFVPSDKNNIPDRRVTDADKDRWPEEWAKFCRTQEEVISGTPVAHWPLLNRAQVAEMKANGFLTVEAIANCPDSQLKRLGADPKALIERAKQHLQPQDEIETELRVQIADLEAERNEDRARIENMESRLTALAAEQSKPKRGPGRPRKVRTDDAENDPDIGA